jgi:hypothetical protein
MPLSHTHEHKGGSSSDSHKHADGEEGSHSHSDSSSSSKKVLTEDDLIAYHFLPTPPMSTYLVAWVVGELSHNELQCPLSLAPTPAPSSSSGRRRLQHEGEEHEHEHERKDGGGQGGKHNVTVRVWGTNDRVAQFGHARDVACAALQEMEKLTQVCVCGDRQEHAGGGATSNTEDVRMCVSLGVGRTTSGRSACD